MRLLHTKTLTLTEFHPPNIPKYVIASHTWTEDEATFSDIEEKKNAHTAGHRKVEAFATYVEKYVPGVHWLWIDTCCIDKMSAAELSDAINSMFRWYREAEVCLAYLADVPYAKDGLVFASSRWFTRGWTLPELLAPTVVIFLANDWRTLGHKGRSNRGRSGIQLHTGAQLNDRVAAITKIPKTILGDFNESLGLRSEEKLQWMQGRQTTRGEDTSYCLLGLLDIHMPINYGEGPEQSKRRLFAEIQRRGDRSDGTTSHFTTYHGKSGLIEQEHRPFDSTVPFSNVPLRRDPDFVARDEIMEQIVSALSKPAARLALVGPGGFGKTKIAIEYCSRVRATSPDTFVLWIDASNAVRYEQSIRDTAKLLGFPNSWDRGEHIYQLFQEWLRRPTEKWLIVLDDAKNLDFLVHRDKKAPSLYEQLPICTHGTVLITSRDMSAALKLVERRAIITVSGLTKQQATALFEKKLGPDANYETLAAKLGYSPLGLAATAAMIQQQGTQESVQEIIERLMRIEPISSPGRAEVETASLCEVFKLEYEQQHESSHTGRIDLPSPSDSDISDAESTYSIFSTASLASSVSSLGSTGLTEETIRSFVDHIFCTTQLNEVHRAALEDEAIGAERYRRNIRRMIANFGIALKAETVVSDQLFAAKVISSRRVSERAARVIVEQIGQPQRSEPRVHTDDSAVMKNLVVEMSQEQADNEDTYDLESECSESSSNQEEPEDFAREQFMAAKQFLEDSHALSDYKQSLVEFVHQPYENRIRRCLTIRHTNSVRKGDAADGEPLLHSQVIDRQGVDAFVTEMSWAPPSVFDFCSSEEITLMDRLKCMVEDLMGGELDWQPFSAPTREVPHGATRIKWQTPCGGHRSVDVPEANAKAFQIELKSAPAFLCTTDILKAAKPKSILFASFRQAYRGCANVQGNHGSSHGTGLSVPRPTYHSTASAGRSSGIQQSQAPPNMATNHLHLRPSPISSTPVPRHVFLGIQKGSDYHFANLRIHDLTTDAKVFTAIRKEYLAVKNTLLYWLWIWRYDHCEFAQLSKYAMGGAHCGEGFPSPSEVEYEFQPRPIKLLPPFGPIPKKMFRDRFYTFCEDCCHRWHRRQMQRWVPGLRDKDDIMVLPKRQCHLNIEDGKRENFWGLMVRERLSGSMFCLYIGLLNMPAVIFFFLWLFDWGHDSDLQNAYVPAGLSIPLTVAFVGWIYQTHGGGLRILP